MVLIVRLVLVTWVSHDKPKAYRFITSTLPIILDPAKSTVFSC